MVTLSKVTITPPERQQAAKFPIIIAMCEACMFDEKTALFGDDDHEAEGATSGCWRRQPPGASLATS